MPISPQGHVDTYLTNLAVDFYNDADQFVAGKVFPTIPVDEASGLYYKWDKGYFLRDEMRERPLGERARRIQYKTSSGRYTCIEEAVSHAIDDRERPGTNNPTANPLDPDEAAMRLLTQQGLIHQERTWASRFFKTGVWTTDLTGVSSAPSTGQFLQWDQTGSDPADQIAAQQDAQAGLGSRPGNTLVLGRAVLRALKKHPSIKDAIKYTQTGIVTMDILAAYLGVARIFVPGGIQNTAKEGQTDAFDFIVGQKSALLVYANPNPSRQEPSGGYTFAWTGLIPGATNAFGGVITRYREDQAHSDVFEIRVAGDQEIVAPDMGVFFSGAVA
jgi:hypothetical protein